MTERYQQIGIDQYLSRIEPNKRTVGPILARELDRKKGAIGSVIKMVAQEFGINEDEMLGPSRKADIVIARHAAAHFLQIHTGLSFRGIALSLGRNDHTTAMNAIHNFERLMEINPEFKERIENNPLSAS